MGCAAVVLASALALAAADPPAKLLFEGMVIAPGELPARESKAGFRAEVQPRDVFALANLITEPEIYHDFVSRIGDPHPRLPIIDSIEAYPGGGAQGALLDGALARITGRNLASTARIAVGGRSCPPLAVGSDFVVARLAGAGPVEIRLINSRGRAGPAFRVLLVRVTGEAMPPRTLRPGELHDGLLRIEGTDGSVAVRLAVDTPSVSFDGLPEIRLLSSGGSRNVVPFTLRAEKPGPFRLTVSLTGHGTSKPPAIRPR